MIHPIYLSVVRPNKIFAYNSDINFDFVAFLKVMSPAVIVIMVVFVIIIMLRLNGKMNVTAEGAGPNYGTG